MKAITIVQGKSDIEILEIEEPQLTAPTQVKIRILEVGVCGTDREQVEGKKANPPVGCDHLIIGHEMFGEVVEVGARVTKVKKGDYAVFTVRRGCEMCIPCKSNRSDMCYSGAYVERGIKGIHGFATRYVVDDQKYLIKVTESLRDIGVLAEPMSVAEKAIDEAVRIQGARLPNITKEEWLVGKKALVVGMGAIGLLAAVILRLRGAEVIGMDIVDEASKRATTLKHIGGKYIDGRKVKPTEIDDNVGDVDFIFEAAGVAELGFKIIDALGINGIYVMTGIPGEARPVCFEGADMMRQIVLKNQIILGSINAGVEHFDLGIRDLETAKDRWPGLMEGFITTKVDHHNFTDALHHRSDDDIKTVITWGSE